MNNDDLERLELPDPDEHLGAGWSVEEVMLAQRYARAAIHADRQRRFVKERAQLEQEWSGVKNLQRAERAQAAEPVEFLCQGARVKLSFSDSGKVSALANYRNELDGRWVALVAAENDRHLKRPAPAEVAEETAGRIVDAVLADLQDRFGIGGAFDDIDDGVKDEIRETLIRKVRESALGGGE